MKSVDDINVDELDLSLHRTAIPKGTVLYRITPRGKDPLKPTGKECRFAKEPPQYAPQKYEAAIDQGTAVLCGTGNVCFSLSLATVRKEVGKDLEGEETYKITLKSDIEVVDIDSICRAEGVGKPYITEERTEFWHRFYGRGVNGLRYPSAKNTEDYNIVIFPDNFPRYRDVFLAEKF